MKFKKQHKPSQRQLEASMNFSRMFIGVGEVPLTDELITQLIKDELLPSESEGMLRQFGKDGAMWNKYSNSIVLPEKESE